MGRIAARKRKDGTVGYTARVQIKKAGKVVFTQAQTFDREAAAKIWIAKKEKEFASGGLPQAKKALTVSQAIDRYIEQSRNEMGRTKEQVLNAVKNYGIGDLECLDVRPSDVVDFATELGATRQPQTVMNYLSHLGSVFAITRSAWGIDMPRGVMRDALDACKRLGLVAKSTQRERRPTRDELDKLYRYFQERRGIPMDKVLVFAVFSARRQEEVTRILWSDLEPGRIMVRDMKNPGQKKGNNVWCVLPPEAEVVVATMPKRKPEIFPFTTYAISAAFTRACKILGIEDLHFHDLRHEGASRLFEMGWTIPQVATVTGHRSWQSLQRYSHLRATGDPLANWP